VIVDLFAGPGGWDVGATRLGLDVTGIERDRAACETRRAAGLGTVEGDVREYGPADFPDATDAFGSPPCQPFSVGGKGAGRKALDAVLGLAQTLAARQSITRALKDFSDERTGLVLEPLRWALQAIDAGRPYRRILLEQVGTVLPVWEAFAQILRSEGYSVTTGRLSAEEYGVPQTRIRAFLAAVLDGETRLPEPTHQRYRRGELQVQEAFGLKPWISMADAIGWGMTHRPALTVAVGTAAGGPDPSCVGGSGARATLYGERDAGRWIDCRRIVDAGQLPAYRGGRRDTIRVTPEDAALLQTFPASHPFQGSQTKRYEQIGNAVPCLLAEHVIATVFGIPMTTTDTGRAAA
jgi:DNA (cytosine-5)-methyltransferase 1